ncbi:TPA: hypothetical protein H1005_00210 [archaeon]|uniref:Uncharacterized protein n=1 Tax=Candidatus Naiadarchaeum limnaeum TaxID=2756139 RepID=A0A832X651_9ARCH|nr:hypothetical protein [Candidatus Naiadarchaeales archaeon SRR2090153.bin1042]HIK00515.1 hypothetical protein [Candidatus Naiadarchaeum limnaeum]
MPKRHVWKVFEFSGWFILLMGVIFGLLYSSIALGTPATGAGFLVVLGIILVLIGEYLLGEYQDHKYMMVFNALSIGGAFSLTVGILWFVIQLLENYQSWFAVVVMLAIGVGLIVVGESIKIEK